jgi:predicted acyltransferase
LKERFLSLDVFRGATVAGMILVNNPGSWGHMFSPLKHAAWHGCTPTDLVFPFFLFAVGNAFAFVMPGLQQGGTGAFYKKVVKRTILIFLIGLLLTWWPFVQWRGGELVFKHWVNPDNPESGIRILGVLQRIALCYFFAAIILYYFKIKGAAIISAIILLGYWLILYVFGDPADPYSMDGYAGNAIDKSILGVAHMYKGEGKPFDPEGILSTLPAIVQVILGYFAGYYIRLKGKTYEMITHLFVAGCVLVFAGFFWDLAFPINKKIWTSSYVVYTTGLALLIIATIIWAIEMKGWKGAGARFFEVFGKNPLFIFALSALVPKTLALLRWTDRLNDKGDPVYITPLPWFYQKILRPLFEDQRISSFLYSVCFLLVFWAICHWMDKKKIYIKV